MKECKRPYDLDDGDHGDASKHESDGSREEDPEHLEQDDGNVEEVDQVLEEDDVVHVDDAHVAPSADEEILDDLELDAGPYQQDDPCWKHRKPSQLQIQNVC